MKKLTKREAKHDSTQEATASDVHARECNECTKCCEGWLTTEVNFRPVYPGKPCYLLQLGKGCERYDARPIHPCATYSCAWKADIEIPDAYKPDVCNVVMNINHLNEFPYLALINAPDAPSEEMIEWAKEYSVYQKIGILWTDAKGQINYFGPQGFCELAANIVGSASESEKAHFESFEIE